METNYLFMRVKGHTYLFLIIMMFFGNGAYDFSTGFAFAADPTNPDLLSQDLDAFWASTDNDYTGYYADRPTYDFDSKTITFGLANSNIGWGFWGDGQADQLAEYKTCTIEFEPVNFDFEFIVANWANGAGELVKKQVPAGTSKVVINIPSPATNITFQFNGAATLPATLTLTSAKLTAGGEEKDCPVIMDFSGIIQEDNIPEQQGWKAIAPIMDKVAAAKYLVIETEGIGDNIYGFGGIDFIVQGGGDTSLSWTQVGLISGGWLSYPRADGKTVSIVIDLQNVLGSKNAYNSFIQCTSWAQLFIQYYPGGGGIATAFEGLGFKQAYLTTDFPKPADAVDLTGGTNFGFIFEGSVACSQKTVLPPSNNAPGVHVYSPATDTWAGVNIIFGNDAIVWPWSTAGDNNLVAFTPVKDATYHLTFNVTSTGASGFRVRWIKDDTNDGYTASDNSVVSSSPYNTPIPANQIATVIPAYFQNTIASGETKTYSADITMDGSQLADQLVGNLAIRGQSGSNDFIINTIVITDAAGNMLVNYDKDAAGATTPVPQSEYQALTALYYSTNGENWYNQWDISQNNEQMRNWYGVTIEGGHVTKINLYNNGLSGELPEELGNLTYLKELNLSYNYYYTGYPDYTYKYLGGTIPSSIGNLKNLQILNLYSNQFSGNIPTTLGNLQNLQYLDLSNNQLTGLIPASFNNLTELNSLYLEGNQLSGTIPSLADLTKLQYLYLYYNQLQQLEGILPDVYVYGMNIGYQSLSIDTLYYTGHDVVINLPNICLYDYSGKNFSATNQFTIRIDGSNQGDLLTAQSDGSLIIPASCFSSLNPNQIVSIYQNNGTAYGTTITFKNNKIELEAIPDIEYEALVALYNATHGETWYNQWDISKNNVHEGTWYGISMENGHVTKIDLPYNGLYGELPEELGNLTYLKELNLSNNYYYIYYPDYAYKTLEGAIPISICSLSNLTTLDLSYNQFSGNIPSQLGNLAQLQYLWMGTNKLTGSIPSTLNNLTELRGLSLDYNQLTGTIPSFTGLQQLDGLYLGHNRLDSLESALPNVKEYMYMDSQSISRDSLFYTGEDVTIILPNICLYDYSAGTFTATSSFYFQIDGNNVGSSITANSDGTLTIPASYISGLRSGQKVSIYQNDWTAYGTTINFENNIINLPHIPDVEYEALVALYNSTHGETWNNQWDVSVNNLNEGPWYGISIENGHITKIDLPNNGLYGELPEELGNLTYLKELNLSNNYYYTYYPDYTYKYLEGNIPAEINQLTQLSVLNLSSNNFSGNILQEISGLTNLTQLYLSYNNFSGDIPEEIGSLPALLNIDLSHNKFTGIIPYFSNYANIQTMDFSYNAISEISPDFQWDLWLWYYYYYTNYYFLSNQTIESNVPLDVDGSMITLNLSNICLYDGWNNNFNAQNGFNIYLNDTYKGYVTANESGQLFFTASYFDGMQAGDIIKIIQNSGTASGTQLLYHSLSTMTTPIPDTEYQALVALYNAAGGANWKNTWDISENDLHLHNWYGVNINQGHVISIELQNNNLTGYIPETLNDLPYLQILNLSGNSIESIESTLSPAITTIAIDKQSFDKGELNLDGTVQFNDIPAIFTYDHQAQSFDIMPIFYVYTSYSYYPLNYLSLTAEDAAYWFNNIDENVNFSLGQTIELRQINGSSVGSLYYTINYKRGDANVDGLLNVLDVQQTLNYVLRNVPKPFNYGAANLNTDAMVNVLDLILMVDLIQTSPLEMSSPMLRSANESAELQVENGVVYLSSPVEIAAFDIRISGASIEGIKNLLEISDIQFSVKKINDTDQVSILAFSLTGKVIPAGKIPLFTIDSGQKIEDAVLADKSAKSIAVQVSNAPTSVIHTFGDKTGLYNAPNPFSMETEFIYYLPETVTSAQIKIYNSTGQLVEVVSNLPIEQGKHSVIYHNNRLPAGIYYYDLETTRNNEYSIRDTNKLIIKK